MQDVKMINKLATIAEMTNGIILTSFTKEDRKESEYQSEADLEDQLIKNLISQGYERFTIKSNTNEELLYNLRIQIQRLNKTVFKDSEWKRFLDEYLDSQNEGMIEKTRKIQENNVYDFTFDDGHLENIKIIDKENIHNNFLQVINQVTTENKNNRYDVTILVNGLPLVHIELKKRGLLIKEAFDQIQRYKKESFNDKHSIYQYVQIFVISNGTNTRYFANTTAENKNNFEFTCQWADAKNKTINDLEDFTKTFFERRVILEILTKYCIFDSNNTLLVMRPYQIAATERILWKIKSSYENKKYGTIQSGGFIWHTTGSGKTLTSFKAARLATELNYIDKVFFIVDRKDLDYQTMKEYKRFQEDSVNGSKDTKELTQVINKNDNRIVVTTIQKLNEFIKKNPFHEIYNKHCVLIFDECHRSQFGEAQKNIKRLFKKYYQFGFTGTPIFPENALKIDTTADVFGAQLHSYVITDAIRDEKVLKFKVDYNNTAPKFKKIEEETDEEKIKKSKNKFNHPERIKEITKHILTVYNQKTHRTEIYDLKNKRLKGFNAMFAVENIEAAKLYYEEFEKQQRNLKKEEKLKIFTIFSYNPNEEQKAEGEISEENFNPSALDTTAKEFLIKVINDYNAEFKTNFSIDGNSFQNYYKDLSLRVRNKEVDLLIVVSMFLTGFDAPTMNTLFVDKNLRYHGLIQAFSRTNRILNKVKQFGNIVCFRDLEKATKNAILLFGDENSVNTILEKSFDEYMNGYQDKEGFVQGYRSICEELVSKFSDPTEIYLEKDKREFVILFGKLLRFENILKNYDEFQNTEKIISERQMQDMRSVYVDIKEQNKNRKRSEREEESIDYSDIEFEIELLKVDEINLDYILALIFAETKKEEEKKNLEIIKDKVRRLIKSSIDIRAKEDLIIRFIDNFDIYDLKTKDEILEKFYTFAKEEKNNIINKIIQEERLVGNAKEFIQKAITNGCVSMGEDLDKITPSISRLGGKREKKKEEITNKIYEIIEIYSQI